MRSWLGSKIKYSPYVYFKCCRGERSSVEFGVFTYVYATRHMGDKIVLEHERDRILVDIGTYLSSEISGYYTS